MASKLGSLAPELLEAITDDLDSSDLARLLRCSKSFQQRLEPILYGSKDLCNRAMNWACLNGNLSTIHRAIAYGASINAIETPHVMKGKRKLVKVLPLHLTARRNHSDAFKLLLKLGARVDDSDVDTRQLNYLMKCLCKPVNFPLLEAFLKAGLDSQVRTRQCSEAAWPLIPAIRSGASLHIIRLLLDRGANPNQLQVCQGCITMSPLSAAIMANSVSVFNLLLERGAKIDGIDFRDMSQNVQHIPIFAATQVMARHAHGRQMMQLCLDNGANINRRAISIFYCYAYSLRKATLVTPVLIYLDSIEKWQVNPERGRGPADDLTYLLECGASTKYATEPLSPRIIRGTGHWLRATPKLFDFLLRKWGLSNLSNPEFSATTGILAQHGAVDASEMVMDAWNAFLTSLSENQKPDIKLLLQLPVLPSAIETPGGGWRKWEFLGEVFRTRVHGLLADNADINGLVPSALLFFFCTHHRDVRTDYGQSILCYEKRYKMTSLLLSKGAEPTMVIMRGNTAIDIVKSELKYTRVPNRRFVLDMLSVLGGAEGNGQMMVMG